MAQFAIDPESVVPWFGLPNLVGDTVRFHTIPVWSCGESTREARPDEGGQTRPHLAKSVTEEPLRILALQSAESPSYKARNQPNACLLMQAQSPPTPDCKRARRVIGGCW